MVAEDSGEVVAVSSGGSPSSSVLLPAGDVNGDGVRDLLDVRYGKAANGHQAVMTAVRSGEVGTVLWQRIDEMAAGHFVFPIATSVGSAGHPGLVLLDMGFEKRSNDTIEVTDKLTALDGHAGKRLWQHADKGTVGFANSLSATHEPNLAGFLQTSAGPKSALITFADYSDNGSGELHGSVAFYRIDGATGAARRVGTTVTSSDSIPLPLTAPDLSGDGREDYLVVTGGSAARVEARRGDTGQPVWANTSLTLQPGSYAEPVGKVMAGRVQDLAVVSGPPQPMTPELGTPVGDVKDPTTPTHGEVSLLRGDTGAKVWTQTGDGAFGVQRAGAGKVPAVGVTTADTASDANGTTETLHLQAYDVAGTQVYDKAHTLQVPADRSDGTFAFGFASAWAVGDLQRDGAQDGMAFLFAIDGNNVRERDLLFDGATGEALPGEHDMLGGTLTGAGHDLVDVGAGSAITVTARSGRDLHALFVRRLTTRSRTDLAYAYAERLRGRCGSVIVIGAGKTTGYAAVLNATGAVRWSIEHASTDLRAKPPTVGAGSRSTACA